MEKRAVTGFVNLSIREEQKEVLDELKTRRRKETGENPSYSEILDEVLNETGVVEEKKRKEKGRRDFMELF